MRRALLLLVLLLPGFAPAPQAHAQVRRCVSASGSLVYTDRLCPDIGAAAVTTPTVPAGSGGAASTLRSLCARSVRDLAYGLESAVQSGDANQISSLYDWTGVGNAEAERLMDHFDRIATRPFVDLVPVYASANAAPPPDGPAPTTDPAATASPAPSARPLVGLRIEQVLSDGHTPSHESFGIIKRMGCWWIRG